MRLLPDKVSPVSRFPGYTGPHSVGSVDLEIPVGLISGLSSNTKPQEAPSTAAARFFYPCQTPQSRPPPVYWIQEPQKTTIGAFAQLMGLGDWLSKLFSFGPNLLEYIVIPVHRNASILEPDNHKGRWPLMIFSHGLGGSRNIYSYICACLASYGIVVVAPEHRDGSSIISYINENADCSKTIKFENVSHIPSDQVYEARDRQLKIRLRELNAIYEVVMMVEKQEELSNTSLNATRSLSETLMVEYVLKDMAGKLDVNDPGSIIWAGHSFGAATVVQLVKSAFYSSQISTDIYTTDRSSSLEQQINRRSATILLDPWCLSLDSPATQDLLNMPMPCFAPSKPAEAQTADTPILTILSAAFLEWIPNFKTICKTLRDPNRIHFNDCSRPSAYIFYPQNSVHLAQSDVGILFPSLMKYVTKPSDCRWDMQLSIRAILELLRRQNVEVAPVNLDSRAIEASKESILDANGQLGDWRILDRRDGAIKDWLYIDIYQPDNGIRAASLTPVEESYDKMAKAFPNAMRPSVQRFYSAGSTTFKAASSTLRSKANQIRRAASYGYEK